MPIMDESDVSLPKATLSKMIRELLPGDLRFGSDCLDMLIECCTAESNDVSTKEKKNTIHPEHVLKALEDLGFGEFVPEVKEAWNSWKEENKNKTSTRSNRPKTAADAAGISEEEQIVMQQMLFDEAKRRSNSFQEQQTTSMGLEERHLSDVSPSFTGTEPPSRFPTLSSTVDASGSLQETPSSLYEELSARSDVLPIHPLSVPPLTSEFSPVVISSAPQPPEQNETDSAPAEVPTPPMAHVLDFTRIPSDQQVIVLHHGVRHVISWQTLLSQVSLMPQLSQYQLDAQGKDISVQMPVSSSPASFMQPSFPEPVCRATAAQSTTPMLSSLEEVVSAATGPFSATLQQDMDIADPPHEDQTKTPQ